MSYITAPYSRSYPVLPSAFQVAELPLYVCNSLSNFAINRWKNFYKNTDARWDQYRLASSLPNEKWSLILHPDRNINRRDDAECLFKALSEARCLLEETL